VRSHATTPPASFVGETLRPSRRDLNRRCRLAWQLVLSSSGRCYERWQMAGTEARVSFGEVVPEIGSVMVYIMSQLCSLVPREYRGGVITHGSSKLLISQNRVLR
jgi:hypothetical protein